MKSVIFLQPEYPTGGWNPRKIAAVLREWPTLPENGPYQGKLEMKLQKNSASRTLNLMAGYGFLDRETTIHAYRPGSVVMDI